MRLEQKFEEYLKLRGGTASIEEIGAEFNLDPFSEVTSTCFAMEAAGIITFDGTNARLVRQLKSRRSRTQPVPDPETYKHRRRKELSNIMSHQAEIDRRYAARVVDFKKYIRIGVSISTFSLVLIGYAFFFSYPDPLHYILFLVGLGHLFIGGIFLTVGFFFLTVRYDAHNLMKRL